MKISLPLFRSIAPLFLALALSLPSVARANEKVYAKLLPSAVCIDMMPFGGGGSGVIVNAQKKWVVTNYHVVREQDTARVTFPFKAAPGSNPYGCEEELGRVIYRDMAKDLAVIALPKLPSEAKQVSMAAVSAKPGQTVHVIGCPALNNGQVGLWIYSPGKVRQVLHSTLQVGNASSMFLLNCQVMLTTLPCNPGDSGGPVVNDNCELVGIVSNGSLNKKAMEYCIDISEVHTVLAHAGKKWQSQ